ncbi:MULTISPECIES: hypothetical protein [Vibrio]|uniref:hypothetical protein n=1 Tax=Vibrio TaxID=662 RepID=UPI0006CC1C35|nr:MULTISPECIES: hypothetical protein [Vibrio]AXN34819.1 hypothetical protein DVV14_26450 [Vibrio coralliilyticus]KPH24992.1 hypothetical protein ADU60_15960 [Vibrio coralliilyticus]QXL80333.1 hypothetical protein [Vibrio sp.]
MSLKSALHALEEYQALTGQEGTHIDNLSLSLKCFFIQSKWLDAQDKQRLKQQTRALLLEETRFCQRTHNYAAEAVIDTLAGLLILKA